MYYLVVLHVHCIYCFLCKTVRSCINGTSMYDESQLFKQHVCTVQVWFQNRRAKMRRQMKLQGQTGDQTVSSKKITEPESGKMPFWDKKDERSPGNSPHQESRERSVSGQASPEVFRYCSIAKLRAKARDYKAEIHSSVAKSNSEWLNLHIYESDWWQSEGEKDGTTGKRRKRFFDRTFKKLLKI